MDSLRLEGGGKSIDLYSWLLPSVPGQSGAEALAGILGFGMAPVSPRWFEGAGAGATWRGSRTLTRPIDLPMYVYAKDRKELTTELSDLVVALDPELGQTRLYFGMADGDEWWVDVVREGGGDWRRKVDSNDQTYFKTTLSLRSGDPFWTRNRPEIFEVKREATDRGLMPQLAMLQVSSGAAFGVLQVENVGDAKAWPSWTIKGPTTKITLIGANGETLIWNDVLLDGQTLFIDARNSRVYDNLGANRYGGLGTSPKFWSIRPGKTNVRVEALNSENLTSIFCQWFPRKQAVV